MLNYASHQSTWWKVQVCGDRLLWWSFGDGTKLEFGLVSDGLHDCSVARSKFGGGF